MSHYDNAMNPMNEIILCILILTIHTITLIVNNFQMKSMHRTSSWYVLTRSIAQQIRHRESLARLRMTRKLFTYFSLLFWQWKCQWRKKTNLSWLPPTYNVNITSTFLARHIDITTIMLIKGVLELATQHMHIAS